MTNAEHVTYVPANTVLPGDKLMERDGYLLTVERVEKLPRGMVAIHMSTGGVLRNCTARVRGTRQVRKFVMPVEVA